MLARYAHRPISLPFSKRRFALWEAVVSVGFILTVLSFFLPLKWMVALWGGLVLAPIMVIGVVSQPLIGIALALILGPMGALEELYIGGTLGNITSGQLMLFFTIACWFARSLLRGKITIAWTFLNVPMLFFIAYMMLTLTWAESLPNGINEVIKWVEMLVIVLIMVDLGRDYSARQMIYGSVGIFLVTGLLEGLLGVWQFAIRGAGPGHFFIFPSSFGAFFRATGTFQQPNPYGGFMSMVTCLSVGVLVGWIVKLIGDRPLSIRLITDLVRFNRLLLLFVGATFIMFLGLVGSWSRGGWLNFLFAMAVFTMLLPRNRFRGFGIAASGLLGLFLLLQVGVLPAELQSRLSDFASSFTFDLDSVNWVDKSSESFAVIERLAHWKAAVNMGRESLWFGQGVGQYEVVYADFQEPTWDEPLGHAHNIYLNLIAEVGMVGLILYLLVWGIIILQTLAVINNTRDPIYRGIALGLMAIWSGWFLHHMLDNLYVNNLWIQLGVLFGLLVFLGRESRSTQKEAVIYGPHD